MKPLRLPMHVGVDALWRTAWATALLAPSVLLLLGAPGAESDVGMRVALGLVGLGVGALLLVLAYLARASDAIFDPAGLRIEGGAHHGAVVPWAELASVELRGDKHQPERDLQLWVRTKRGVEMCLAEAARELEKGSVRALHQTLLGVLGDPGAPPPRSVELHRCAACGAALRPSTEAAPRCHACGATSALPGELRERVAAQLAIDAAKSARAEAVVALLEQPGATKAVGSLVLAGVASASAWIVVFLGFAAVGVAHLGPFELGVGWFNGTAASFAAFGFARIAIARRRALLLLCTDFGARPPAKAGEAPGCRECGAPLPHVGGLLARCVYCGAESVLGLPVRPLVERAHARLADLDELIRRQQAERKQWRDLGLVGAAAAGAAAFWLVMQVSVASELAAQRSRCDAGDADACHEVGRNFRVGATVEQNEAEAADYFERACDDDHAEACHDLGMMRSYGWGVPRDERAGRGLLKRACKLAWQASCAELAELEEAP